MKVKKLFVEKTLTVVCSIVLLLVVVFQPILPRWMSAEETVAYYFKQSNARNLRAMQSVVSFDITSGIRKYPFPFLVYVRLISCEEYSKEDVERLFYKKWLNSDVYELAVCRVVYEVKHWPVDWFDGRHSFDFYLVKETKYSNWIIVTWGNA